MQHVGVKTLKSVLDVGLFESMAWARWGAAKWVQNQPRAIAASAYEARADEGDHLVPSLPFQKFWEMVRPAISENASHADVNAVLRCAEEVCLHCRHQGLRVLSARWCKRGSSP